MEKDIQTIHYGLKFAGIIAKNSPNLAIGIKHVQNLLIKHNITPLLEKDTAKLLNLDGTSLDKITKKTKFIISLGGDGTLISVCRKLALKDVFVLGIHAGTLGFLTDIKIDEFEGFLSSFLEGKYDVERPYLLDVYFKKNSGKSIKKLAFNDVAITRNSVGSMAKIDAFLDGKYFNTYHGDGVIVSSPVGSTAYNMSANGPIIYPLCDVFCVTPICSHSLTQRPLVLPKKYAVSFKNSQKSGVSIVIDGQEIFDMAEFDEILVGIDETRANLIRHKERNYFDVLKEKLRWGYGGLL